MLTSRGLPPPKTHHLPTSSADDKAWAEWCTRLRPTGLAPNAVRDVDLPLRVVSCKALESDYRIEFEKPKDWNFAAISHKWLDNAAWPAVEVGPYPAAGPMVVHAVKRKSLLALARLCREMKLEYFWLDCLCIDQKSALEQSREVMNMGQYYGHAVKTLVFPYGVDSMGPPLLPNGDAPI